MTRTPGRTARDALIALQPDAPGIRCAVTMREGATLSMLNVDDPSRWAVVHSADSTWFSLVVDGHYSRDVIDVDAPDDRVDDHLTELVAIAVAHLEGASRVLRRGPGRLRRLEVAVGDEDHLLFAPLARHLARIPLLRSRLVRARLPRVADELLDGCGLPSIADSWMIVSAEAWDLLADIDALQAGLAGSRTWRRTGEGRRLRFELHGEALMLAAALAELGLVDVAVGLSDIAAQLDAY